MKHKDSEEAEAAAAAEAAAEIKAGLNEAFAGAGTEDDAKEPIVVEEAIDDFGLEPVTISGVYLIAPIAGNAAGVGAAAAAVLSEPGRTGRSVGTAVDRTLDGSGAVAVGQLEGKSIGHGVVTKRGGDPRPVWNLGPRSTERR